MELLVSPAGPSQLPGQLQEAHTPLNIPTLEARQGGGISHGSRSVVSYVHWCTLGTT